MYNVYMYATEKIFTNQQIPSLHMKLSFSILFFKTYFNRRLDLSKLISTLTKRS